MKLPALLAVASLSLIGCVGGEADAPWSDGFGARFTPVTNNRPILEGTNETALTADAPVIETMPVFDMNTGEPISGASAALARYEDKHKVAETTKLPPRHVVAMFYVVFNRPENCTAPFEPLSYCSEADLANPAAEPSILWASGLVLDRTGKAYFAAKIGTGLEGAPGEVLFGDGLQNVEGAEVHLLTRDKGLPIRGKVELQRTTYDGGCDVAACADAQFTIFKAPL